MVRRARRRTANGVNVLWPRIGLVRYCDSSNHKTTSGLVCWSIDGWLAPFGSNTFNNASAAVLTVAPPELLCQHTTSNYYR